MTTYQINKQKSCVIEKYNLFDETNIFNIKCNDIEINFTRSIVIFVLDITNKILFKDAIKSFTNLVKKLYDTHNFILITHNIVNSNLKIYDFRGSDIATIKKNVFNIESLDLDEAVDFKTIFDCTAKCVRSLKKECVKLIFFTDKSNTDLLINVDESFQKMFTDLHYYTTSSSIHCIGYGDDHNSYLLLKIIQQWDLNGTYQYIKHTHEIDEKLNELIPLLHHKILYGTISTISNESYDLTFYYSNKTLTCTKILSDIININSLTVYDTQFIKFNNNDISIKKTNLNIIDNINDIMNTIIMWLGDNMDVIYGKLDKNIVEVKTKCLQFMEQFEKLHITLESCENAYVKYIIQYKYNVIRNLLKYIATFTKCDGNTNKQATLYNLLYKCYIQCQTYNVDIHIHEKLLNIVNTNDNNSMQKEETILNKLHKYFELNLPLIDTIKQANCICLLVNVTLSKTIFRINNIKNILVTSTRFLSRFDKFHLKEKSECITFDLALPLYICKKHWNLSVFWLKTIIDRIKTYYMNDDIDVYPFIILSYLMNNIYHKTNCVGICDYDSLDHTFELVRTVCVKLYEDNKELQQLIKDNVEEYINSGHKIIPEYIKNNEVFLMYVYISKICGKFNIPNELQKQLFITKIIEEEARREQIGYTGNDLTLDLLFNIINEDKKEWFDIEVQQYKDAYILHNFSVDLYEEIVEKKKRDKPKEININAQAWDGNINVLSKSSTNLWNYINETYIEYIQPKLIGLIYIFDIQNISLDEFLHTNEQKIAFVLQNYFDKKDRKRYDAIKYGVYNYIFEQSNAIKYLKNLFKITIAIEKEKIKEQFDKEHLNTRASVFASTINLDEAAYALKGAYIGNNIMKFAKKLQTDKCKMIYEKLQMLLTGLYEYEYYDTEFMVTRKSVIKLYKDYDSHISYTKTMNIWNPSISNCHKLWKNNKESLSQREWIKIFNNQRVEYRISKWILRDNKNISIPDEYYYGPNLDKSYSNIDYNSECTYII